MRIQKHALFTLFYLFSSLTGLLWAEKAPLHHDVYESWNTLSRQQLSDDGRYVSWEINPQQGDGWLFIKDLEDGRKDSIPRGRNAQFASTSNFIAFFIEPEAEAVRQGKIDELSRLEMPQRNMGVITLPDFSHQRVDRVQSFVIPEGQTETIFYHNIRLPEDTLEGSNLHMLNPATSEIFSWERVTDYSVSANGHLLAFVHADQDSETVYRIQAFNTITQESSTIYETHDEIKGFQTDHLGMQLAFLTSNDEDPAALYLWQEGQDNAGLIVDWHTAGMYDDWVVSIHAQPEFSEEGKHLFFGTAPKPLPATPDTLLPEEKHSVDVWHYRDPLIQPMQLVRLSDEQKRSYQAIYHIDDGRMIQLADDEMPEVVIDKKLTGRFAMGYSLLPYLIRNSFESGDFRDVYLVDIQDGSRTMILEKHRGSVHRSRSGDARLSPGGNYLLYYEQSDRNWYSRPLTGNEPVNLTSSIPVPLNDELHDAPSEPDSYGIAGWVENDLYVLIYDRYDIWKVDPTGEEDPVSLTNGYGRENHIRFRYVNLNPDEPFIGRREQIMLSAFDIYSKKSGFYQIRIHRPGNPDLLVMDDVRFFNPDKAKSADVIAWRKSTFKTFPDLWVSDADFSKEKQVSTANPQQDQFLWGDVQLVDWVSFANDSLQGLIYFPEEMDPDKKYPIIVYFYERLSDRKHIHYIPSPSRSTVNISYAVSNGYIVFVPDIPYIIGYPGQSAYNAVVSGTKAMLNQFDAIDRDNIGIQGQSWAGYQIAWLITRTDMFKTAMAGAPVSNMISAYGGIRWSTGMSRIYQYEETQSRIGGTIWDQTLRYIENSPVFFADKVNTPLLMMHNDADGAVPWYQGIEYFMALRRLNKPVWMLNYNDEAHNLTRWPNRVDLSHRMFDFFDHYLKDTPAPVWMIDGIPAIKKNM